MKDCSHFDKDYQTCSVPCGPGRECICLIEAGRQPRPAAESHVAPPTRPAFPTHQEIIEATQLYRAEIEKRMDVRHPSASPSIESMTVVLRDLWLKLTARTLDVPLIVSATRTPIKWLVRAGGERYDVWPCNTREDVRTAFIEALYGSVETAQAENTGDIAAHMEQFDSFVRERKARYDKELRWTFEDGWLEVIDASSDGTASKP